MRTEILEKQIEEDIKAGIKPICIVATIGTTSTTSIDPIKDIVPLCKKHNLWLHVDAAYGGSAVLSLKSVQNLLAGNRQIQLFKNYLTK